MLLFYILSAGLLAADVCPPEAGAFSPEYEKVRAARDKAFKNLHTRKDVAQTADQVLMDLIQSKSAALHAWLEKSGLRSKSEDAIALGWRDEFARTLALADWKYPWVEGIVTELTQLAFPRKTRLRIETLFSEAKSEALAAVSDFQIPDTEKAEIQKRMKGVKLVWMRGGEAKKRPPIDVIAWGIAYDPTSNTIDLGIDALQYTEEETLFAAFAHELGHVFDPCRWNAHFRGPQPFTTVLECLRTSDSVGAKNRDDSEMNRLIENGQLSKQLALGLRLNPSCNRSEYPPTGIQADQLPEVFSDWFSAEILARNPKRITAALRSDLCRPRELAKGSSYPDHRRRLERIYYAHPKIRETLKETLGLNTAAPLYCKLGK